MRKHKDLAKKFLTQAIEQKRKEEGLTQEKMSERLRITPRSYNDIALQKNGVSATTLLFFLSGAEAEEIQRMAKEFLRMVEQAEESA